MCDDDDSEEKKETRKMFDGGEPRRNMCAVANQMEGRLV